MKQLLYLFTAFILTFSACTSDSGIIEPVKNDLTNIGDSAYFLIKFNGKEYFSRENPAKKIYGADGVQRVPGDRIVYDGSLQAGKLDSPTLIMRHSVYMPEQSFEKFMETLKLGREKAPSSPESFFTSFALILQNQDVYHTVYRFDSEEYFDILETKSLTETRGTPTVVLVKYKFKFRAALNGKPSDQDEYMEGEGQMRLRYKRLP